MLAPEGQVSRTARPHRVVAHILEHLARMQVEQQPRLVFGEVKLPRIGKYDARIVEPSREVVDYHAVEHAGLAVLTLDIEVHIGYLVIERPLGDFDLGRLLTHREHQRPHLCLGDWQHIVLKEERPDGNKGHQPYQRPHDAEKRYTRCLHRRKLEFLAEITEYHKACQQHRKGQRRRHHGQGGIEKQLGYHAHRQAFADKVVDKAP